MTKFKQEIESLFFFSEVVGVEGAICWGSIFPCFSTFLRFARLLTQNFQPQKQDVTSFSKRHGSNIHISSLFSSEKRVKEDQRPSSIWGVWNQSKILKALSVQKLLLKVWNDKRFSFLGTVQKHLAHENKVSVTNFLNISTFLSYFLQNITRI